MSHYFSDSAMNYDATRRRRVRINPLGYYGGPIEEVVGAEVAAGEASLGAGRAIFIGVATGVLTLLVNRWVEKLLK